MGEASEIDMKRARELSEHIVRLGAERRQAELVELAHDDSTQGLLDLLPESAKEQAEAHLKLAERWEESRREANRRRLSEARRAVDGLDLELARGLTNKIDGRYLSDAQLEERDELLLEISARTMEMESVTEKGHRLIEQSEPKKNSGDRPWWRRWRN